MRSSIFVLLIMMSATSAAMAQTCMIAPTEKEVVTSRFGIFREGGSGNYGSAVKKPHPHDGLDFSTSGVSGQPIKAVSDGVVVYSGFSSTLGNTVTIRRENGHTNRYSHLSEIDPIARTGAQITSGQIIGRSGNTPKSKTGGGMVPHLHFTYGVPEQGDARAKQFKQSEVLEAHRRHAFNPGQLQTVLTNRLAGVGWRTDPSPYFCKTFPINDGRTELAKVLGSDTKRQYETIFGASSKSGEAPDESLEPEQAAQAAAVTIQAKAAGVTIEKFLNDGDLYGSVPSPPLGEYEQMSTIEMMLTEGNRRMGDAQWHNSLAKAHIRALWIDYLRAMGVGSYLSEAIHSKKERIEALLAIYSAQKVQSQSGLAQAARNLATRNSMVNDIN